MTCNVKINCFHFVKIDNHNDGYEINVLSRNSETMTNL
jgi:hypothetical protein